MGYDGVHGADSDYFFSRGANRVVVSAVHCAALLHGAERGGGACGGGVDDGGDINFDNNIFNHIKRPRVTEHPMIRAALILASCTVVFGFSPTMCQKTSLPPELKALRYEVPIICKRRLVPSDREHSQPRKMVYEATFEHDRIVIRPKRVHVRRSWCEKMKDYMYKRVRKQWQKLWSFMD